MDIGSKHGGASSKLSNFAARKFIFDGVECGSAEGLLQALKEPKSHLQVQICKLVGFAAKKRGRECPDWKLTGTLWWQGTEIDRYGPEYQHLLDRVYLEIARQSEEFCEALLSTGDQTLTHAIGKTKPHDTILTQSEFCDRLHKIRHRLSNGLDLSHL